MRDKVSGIYKITCVSNGDYYYGSAQDFESRWSTHRRDLRKNKHYNSRVQRVWNKYGEASFFMERIEFVPIEKLFEVENKYLKEHVGNPHCMNISSDAYCPTRGRKMGPCSEERRRKIGDANRGKIRGPRTKPYKKWSAESRQRASDVQRGKKRGPHSIETRRKISVAHTGKRGYHHTPEARKKIAIASKNRIVSDETRRKIGAGHKGMRHTEETKERISKLLTGRKLAPDHKRNVVAAIKRRPHAMSSEEARRKVSNTLMGHSVSDETRCKIRDANIGNKMPPRTAEQRHRASEASKAQWVRAKAMGRTRL